MEHHLDSMMVLVKALEMGPWMAQVMVLVRALEKGL